MKAHVRHVQVTLGLTFLSVILLSGALPSFAQALTYQTVSGATWASGSWVNGAVGTAGKIYGYAHPVNGAHVTSLYVRSNGAPTKWAIEAGYTATGSNPLDPSLPTNHNPWFFVVSLLNGQYTPYDFNYAYPFPVGQRRLVTISNTTDTGDNWCVYLDDVLFKKFYTNGNLISGRSQAGCERDYTSDPSNASVTYMQFMAWSGGSPSWQYWNYGSNDPAYQNDPSWWWYFDHVGEANHWIYTSTY